MKRLLAVGIVGAIGWGCGSGVSAEYDWLDPAFRDLPRSQLEALPDSMLENAIVQHVLWKVATSDRPELDIVRELPPGQRAVYTTRSLEAEVYNGGFQQYFWNPDGELAAYALAGYRLLDAVEHADLVRRAMQLAEEERETRDSFQKQRTLEAFTESYEHTRLGELDEAFWDLGEPWEIRRAFIRQDMELVIPAVNAAGPSSVTGFVRDSSGV